MDDTKVVLIAMRQSQIDFLRDIHQSLVYYTSYRGQSAVADKLSKFDALIDTMQTIFDTEPSVAQKEKTNER